MIPACIALYANAPVGVRARAWGQWLTTPLDRVEAQLPARGRILEVGCGIGLFACRAALASHSRAVVGVDEELDDIVQGRLAARHAGPQGARVDFRLTPPGEVPDGPWDAVVMIDVLSRLDGGQEQQGLVRSCAEQLALGGMLVVKEMARAPRSKAVWNRALDLAARRETPPDPTVVERWMQQAGLVVSHQAIDRGYRAPHHLVLGSRRRSVR